MRAGRVNKNNNLKTREIFELDFWLYLYAWISLYLLYLLSLSQNSLLFFKNWIGPSLSITDNHIINTWKAWGTKIKPLSHTPLSKFETE